MCEKFEFLSKLSTKIFDNRGFLEVLYENSGVVLKRSFSKKGVFRGMHMQEPPFLQTKLIRVITGRIIDFVVDPSSVEKEIYWTEIDPISDWVKIDSKFAHGFLAVEDTLFEYICDGAYNEKSEKAYSVKTFMSDLFENFKPIMSDKDEMAEMLKVFSKVDICESLKNKGVC